MNKYGFSETERRFNGKIKNFQIYNDVDKNLNI